MKRIIGVIGLFKSGSVIQTVSFQPKNIVHASSVHAVHKFYRSGMDEIVLIDLTRDGLPFEFVSQCISSILKQCFIPVIYAGHLNSADKIDKLFRLGIDRVLSCSNLLTGDFDLARYVIQKYGSQAFVAGVDAQEFSLDSRCMGRFFEANKTAPTVGQHFKALSDLGVSEIFLNSPFADGQRKGYALVSDKSDQLISYSHTLGVSLVAMGGAWDLQHFSDAAKLGFAGLAAANCFHYREAFPLLVKKYLKENNFDVVV